MTQSDIAVQFIGDRYVFDDDHPFSRQIATFAVIQVCLSTTGQSLDLTKPRLIFNKGKVVDSVLLNGRELLHAISRAEFLPPPQYTLARAPDLPIPGCQADYRVPSAAWKHAAQVCIGSAYEIVKYNLYKHYGGREVNWPPELQLFRHARNASFHGNDLRIRSGLGRVTSRQVV